MNRVDRDVAAQLYDALLGALVESGTALTDLVRRTLMLAHDRRTADERSGVFLRPMMTASNIAKADAVADLAVELGLKPSQLALAWCLRNRNVASVIAGATKAVQVTQNAVAAGVSLDEETQARIEAILAAD